LVQQLNTSRYANVITLERLREYLFPSGKCMITQRTVPVPVPSFLQGIQDALDGQAVDVLMIGEAVDQATMDAMLRAAESGHLVLATMHAATAAGAISRIVDMFPADERQARLNVLAERLVGVIAQKLLPNRSGDQYVLAYEVLTNSEPAVAEAIRAGNTKALHERMHQGGEQGMVTFNQTLKRLVQANTIERVSALSVRNDRSELEELLRTR
jgi:twitching motility protein PilT